MKAKELFINLLINEYTETRRRLKDLDDVVNDIDFTETYTEDEQMLLLKEYHALDDYCNAKKKRIRYMIAKAKEVPDDDEGCHCGQDAEEEVSMPPKELLGMEVVGVGKGRCEGCPAEHYHAGCCKVELVGGDYICLAKPEER